MCEHTIPSPEQHEKQRPVCQFCHSKPADGTMHEQFHDHYNDSNIWAFTMFACEECGAQHEREELPYPSIVRGSIFRKGVFVSSEQTTGISFVDPRYYRTPKRKWGWSHDGD